jgi:hypothetical protein
MSRNLVLLELQNQWAAHSSSAALKGDPAWQEYVAGSAVNAERAATRC